MKEEKIVGLLLQSIPYLGNKKILKVLTPEGLLSFISGKKALTALTMPFAWAEWVYKGNKKEIQFLQDGTMLDDLSVLKENYAGLSMAGQMAQDLLRTQMPGKPATEAITLTLACFRKMHLFSEPRILLAAFRLKLLHCEGLIGIEEAPAFEMLLLSRSFAQLASLPKEEKLLQQIDLLFEERVNF